MVSTRHHPRAYPPPDTPSSDSTAVATRSESPTSPTTALATRRASPKTWAHTPSNATLIWLAISLPLVIWDTGYVLLRPYSMPGGSLHAPIWTPYKLYGEVDYVYGQKAVDEKNGFTAAQGTLNVVETVGYLIYLYMLYIYGTEIPAAKGRGAPRKFVESGSSLLQRLARPRMIGGSEAGTAVLLLFSISVMTVSKTVLYWLNEYYSGFANIGHNSLYNLVFLWLIPNGAWIVVPSYMIYVCTQEILEGLAVATGEHKKKQ